MSKFDEASKSARSIGQDVNGKISDGVSMFTTGTKDTLMAADAYGRSALDTLRSTKDGILESIAKAKDWLSNTPLGPLGSFKDIMQNVSDIKDNIQAIKQDIQNAVQGSIGMINSITDDVMRETGEILDDIRKYSSEDYWRNEVLGDINREYNQLVNQVNNIVLDAQNKINSFQSTYEQMAIDLGLMKNAANIGSIGIVNAIMNKYPNEKNAKEVLGTAFPQAIYNGNLEMMANIIRWCGADYVMNVFPDSIRMIIMNFRFAPGIGPNQYASEADKLVAVLVSLNPRWEYYRDGLHNEINLQLFVFASRDTYSAFEHRPPYDRVVAIATRFASTRDLKDEARAMYPTSII